MIAQINLTKEKVCKFFGISKIPYEANGFKIIEHNDKFFILGEGHHAPAIVTLQIEYAFMKSGCPYFKKDGTPIIQTPLFYKGEDMTKTLSLLGFTKFNDKTMCFPKRRYTSKKYEDALEKALLSSNLYKHYNKAYELMCITKDKRLYKKLQTLTH